jgi:hypothetical protein
LALAVLAALYNARQRRQAQLPGGYSITVNVPAKLARRARHEVAEKRDVQRMRDSDRLASSVSSIIPEKTLTPPNQRTVAIYFTSNPAGASIRLDGESNPDWITPYTIADIIPGSHRVVFAKQGYSPEIRDLEIGPRDATYGVELVPK